MAGFSASIASKTAWTGRLGVEHQRNVAHHRREPRRHPRPGQRQRRQGLGVQLEQRPAAAAARICCSHRGAARRASRPRAPSDAGRGPSARVERGMRRGLEAQRSGAHSASRSALTSKKSTARGGAPHCSSSARAEGRRGDAHRLAHAAHRERPVRRRRIAQEHAPDLEHADARHLAVVVVLDIRRPASRSGVVRITDCWLAIGLSRRIGFGSPAKSASQRGSTKLKLITSRYSRGGEALAQRRAGAPCLRRAAACVAATRGGCAAMRSKP